MRNWQVEESCRRIATEELSAAEVQNPTGLIHRRPFHLTANCKLRVKCWEKCCCCWWMLPRELPTERLGVTGGASRDTAVRHWHWEGLFVHSSAHAMHKSLSSALFFLFVDFYFIFCSKTSKHQAPGKPSKFLVFFILFPNQRETDNLTVLTFPPFICLTVTPFSRSSGQQCVHLFYVLFLFRYKCTPRG